MNERQLLPVGGMNIAAVERDTGLSKDTLRVWERRYGFPAPSRDRLGERVYPVEQVDRLRILRRLLDAGHRPGRVVALPFERLRVLASEHAGSSGPVGQAASAELRHLLGLVVGHELEALRRALGQALVAIGLERFVTDLVAPLTRMVGEAWARGEIEIFEEHLFTESVQRALRGAIDAIAQPAGSPRVLMTTLPQEAHGLGLLMAEALLALEGCCCLSLGVQTPVGDIAQAAVSQRADIVALSFSARMKPNQVLDGLADLRAMLALPTRLWAGGRCPVLWRRPPAGVTVLADLGDIRPALADWRARAG